MEEFHFEEYYKNNKTTKSLYNSIPKNGYTIQVYPGMKTLERNTAQIGKVVMTVFALPFVVTKAASRLW